MNPSDSSNPSNPHENQMNSDDPYYIHHSDSPGSILVSQILTGDNYGASSRAMTIALSVKNKIDFIDGTIIQPLTTNAQFKSWSRNNNIIISWILNSIPKEIAASVIYLKTADVRTRIL